MVVSDTGDRQQPVSGKIGKTDHYKHGYVSLEDFQNSFYVGFESLQLYKFF